MILRLAFAISVGAYLLLIAPFSSYLTNRPVAVKLGTFPEAGIIKLLTADQSLMVANYAVTKVLFYFGTLVDLDKRNVNTKPEYFNMFKSMETVVKLDPYNMDAYYFMQAAFTWEIGRAKDVNQVLAYGMKYRTWDSQLPFYAGFNASYFLKDYKAAAVYFKKAAELSGSDLYTNLSARYFYESGENELGIAFLDTMTKGAKDPKVKKVYERRRSALEAARQLENAVEGFRKGKRRLPTSLEQLVSAGFIDSIPSDPYGGSFYLDSNGRVRTTSKFAPLSNSTAKEIK